MRKPEWSDFFGIVLVLVSFLTSGCTTTKPIPNATTLTADMPVKILGATVGTQPVAVDSVEWEGGRVWLNLSDGTTEIQNNQIDFHGKVDIKNKKYVAKKSGVRLQWMAGVDCYAKTDTDNSTGSVWGGIRFVHLDRIGLDVGADKRHVTLGGDAVVYGAVTVGINVMWPYLSTVCSGIGLKSAILFP